MKLGVTNRKLKPVEEKPNSVSTQTDIKRNHMEPIPYTSNHGKSKCTIKMVMKRMKRVELHEEQENYLHYIETSKVFKFKDDIEFYFDETEQVIHFRSKSRVGQFDFGVNRKRMQKIRDAFNKTVQ
ncbi:DUF1499 domain-containing protein [Paenisporosarcina sp. TG20]|uniref:DUF1499 domain-containing protein n=1 Tax=Paenisporosarcina sp. TG20 TaxID=1211706 RepID=UPI000310BD91|nr:DUF1499 domain-containing protein [Paenisporosarcina sp. TG20]